MNRLQNWALAQIVIFRLISTAISTLAAIVQTAGNGLQQMSNTVFTLELDGARKYQTLTGVRLGPAIGQPYRYTDLNPEDGRFAAFQTPIQGEEEE